MAPRTRVVLITTVAAALSAAAVVAIGAFQGDRPGAREAAPTVEPRTGLPPLGLDFGVRADAEARALRRAQALYTEGEQTSARAIFEQYDSLEGRVGRAFSLWPNGTLERLEQLAGLHQNSAVVQFHLGLARLWSDVGGEREAWQAAVDAEPDSPYRVSAENLLRPEFFRGIPIFVPEAPAPAALRGLRPDRQLALLRELPASNVSGRLHYGAALQGLGLQVSAERVFAKIAAGAPDNAEAQVAAAVARFDKAAPQEAFSRLGPLSRRFPESASVRFHLGLLLLWSGEAQESKRQLRLAVVAEPTSHVATEAERYLEELRKAGL